jgi:hypothetical protein
MTGKVRFSDQDFGLRDAPTSLLRVDVGFWQKLSFQNFLRGTPKVSHYGGL